MKINSAIAALVALLFTAPVPSHSAGIVVADLQEYGVAPGLTGSPLISFDGDPLAPAPAPLSLLLGLSQAEPMPQFILPTTSVAGGNTLSGWFGAADLLARLRVPAGASFPASLTMLANGAGASMAHGGTAAALFGLRKSVVFNTPPTELTPGFALPPPMGVPPSPKFIALVAELFDSFRYGVFGRHTPNGAFEPRLATLPEYILTGSGGSRSAGGAEPGGTGSGGNAPFGIVVSGGSSSGSGSSTRPSEEPVAPVPLPAPLALLMLGLAALGVAKARSRSL